MRTILPALIGAALVSCEKPADDVTRRLNELEQRAEAAEARSEQLEQQAAEAKLADAIAKVVATAPPLTAEQRNRLATLLMSGDAA